MLEARRGANCGVRHREHSGQGNGKQTAPIAGSRAPERVGLATGGVYAHSRNGGSLMDILVTWVALAFAMWLAARLLPSMEIRGGVVSHLLVSAGFGLLLVLTGWFLHLVLGFLSLGLLFVFSFVARVIVGAIVLKITDAFSDRLRVDGVGTALLASLIIGVVGTAVEALFHSL